MTVIGGDRRCWGCSTVTNRPHLEVMHDGFDAVWCPVCWMERRLGFACLAMSRFLVFAWMEAQARKMWEAEWRNRFDHYAHKSASMAQFRRMALTDAMFADRLCLTWPEGE